MRLPKILRPRFRRPEYPTIFGKAQLPDARDVSMTKEQIDRLFDDVSKFKVAEFRQMVEEEIKPKVSIPFKISEVK